MPSANVALPSRRNVLVGAAAFSAAVAGAGVAATIARRRTAPLNVVILVLDDVHPSSWSKLPYLSSRPRDRWVRFTNGVATFPLCRPSRASILTGRYASRHGLVTNNEPADGLAWMREHERANLLWWAHEAGAQVGFFGKYLNTYPFDVVDPGFAYRPPGVARWHANGSNEYTNYPVSDDGATTQVDEPDTWTGVGYTEAARARRKAPTGYRTDRTSKELNDWLASVDEPFLAIAAHTCPHVDRDGVTVPGAARHASSRFDLDPPASGAFNEPDVADKPAWVRALPILDQPAQQAMDMHRFGQWRSLLAFDEAVYDLIATLERAALLDRTALIVLADNGQILGEHRSFGKAQVYREATRGDIWIRHPDAATRDDPTVVGNIDIAPTVCALLRAVPSTEFDGQDLTPLVLDPDRASRERVLIEYVNPMSATGGGPEFVGWASAHETYAELAQYGPHPPEIERYDHATDPAELTNLGASEHHARLLADLLR